MILAPSFGSKSSKVRTHTTFCLKKDINLGLFQKTKKNKMAKTLTNGSVWGLYLLTGCPFLSTKNLLKFHFIKLQTEDNYNKSLILFYLSLIFYKSPPTCIYKLEHNKKECTCVCLRVPFHHSFLPQNENKVQMFV